MHAARRVLLYRVHLDADNMNLIRDSLQSEMDLLSFSKDIIGNQTSNAAICTSQCKELKDIRWM